MWSKSKRKSFFSSSVKKDKSETFLETFSKIKLCLNSIQKDDFQQALFSIQTKRFPSPCTRTRVCINEYHEKISVSHPRLTFRIKRNPLRTRRERCTSPEHFHLYYLIVILPVRYLRPPFIWIPFSPSLLLLLPRSRAHLIAKEFATHSWRRTTVNTHLLDQPASSLASYSTLWPPTSKRRPGLWNDKNVHRMMSIA